MVLHKKAYARLKTDYRPITCLPSNAKIFERILENHVKQFESSFSPQTFVAFTKIIALYTPFSEFLSPPKGHWMVEKLLAL